MFIACLSAPAGPPKSDRDKVAAIWPHSIRYGREVGNIMLIFIIGLAYAAVSPIILPFTLIYFIFCWVFWRYNILYVSERCFESGGRMWDQIFRQICACLFIFEFFTGEAGKGLRRCMAPFHLLWACYWWLCLASSSPCRLRCTM